MGAGQPYNLCPSPPTLNGITGRAVLLRSILSETSDPVLSAAGRLGPGLEPDGPGLAQGQAVPNQRNQRGLRWGQLGLGEVFFPECSLVNNWLSMVK